MNKNIICMSIIALGVCLLMPKYLLAAEPPRQAYLSAEELLDLYEGTYSRIHNWHVIYSNILEETKGDSPELQKYTRYDTTETIEEEACDKYYARWTNDPNGFDDQALVAENAFNGSVTMQYRPYSKFGKISPGSSELAGEQMSMLWSYMLLSRPQPNLQPDISRIRFYFSPKSTVRPQLEQVNGEWCHVIDAPYTVKPLATVWLAVDKGGLPIKYERKNVGDYSRRIIITKVGSVETDTGKIWYPEQAIKEINDKNGYRLYRFKVQSLSVNIETSPDTFKVSFPDGTDIVDEVAGIYYTTGAFDEKKPFGVLKGPKKRDNRQQSPEREVRSAAQTLSDTTKSESTNTKEMGQESNSVPTVTLGQLETDRPRIKLLFVVLGVFTVCILAFFAYRNLLAR